MRTLTQAGRSLRWVISTMVLVFGIWLSGSGPMAGAATGYHRVAGTYQLSISGMVPETMVLFPNRSASAFNGTGTWSAHHHTVTVTVSEPAPDCFKYNQPPTCELQAVYVGPNTPEGIASQAAPGSEVFTVGTAGPFTKQFWAVRIGRL